MLDKEVAMLICLLLRVWFFKCIIASNMAVFTPVGIPRSALRHKFQQGFPGLWTWNQYKMGVSSLSTVLQTLSCNVGNYQSGYFIHKEVVIDIHSCLFKSLVNLVVQKLTCTNMYIVHLKSGIMLDEAPVMYKTWDLKIDQWPSKSVYIVLWAVTGGF